MKFYRCYLNFEYEVFVVDGSNLEIDRYNLIFYYVLNIVCVFIVYGEKESRFWYRIFFYIYFDQELYFDKDDVIFKNFFEIL